VRVRQATIGDIDEIVAMGQEFVSVPGYRDRLEIEPDVFAERVGQAIMSTDAYVAILEDEGKAKGAIGGLAAASMFTSKRNAVELFWFVRPEARQNGGGRALLEAIIAWAKEADCLALHMIEPPDAPEVGQTYQRRGFSKFETYWSLSCR